MKQRTVLTSSYADAGDLHSIFDVKQSGSNMSETTPNIFIYVKPILLALDACVNAPNCDHCRE